MSTNVGTLALKAPEFFKKTPEGKLRYHRNVDCYAMGLTYLVLLQGDKEKTQLIPQIETPQDNSECHQPIGQLLAERIKYNVKQREIVVFREIKPDAALAMKVEHDTKELIQKMTCVNSEQR